MAGIGYIKLFRKLLDWEWYDDINTKCLFIHCLLKANLDDKNWKGVVIKKGSFLTGRQKLAQELNLTEMQIRTALKKLKSTNEITIKTTSEYSIITINNWDEYQQNNQQNNRQDNQQITSRITTTKEEKNIRRKEYNILLTDFNKFYSLYPRKESKQKALSSFEKVMIKGITIDVLINGLNRYIKHIKDTNKERKYIKQPATWLNQGCWEDEYESINPAGPSVPLYSSEIED